MTGTNSNELFLSTDIYRLDLIEKTKKEFSNFCSIIIREENKYIICSFDLTNADNTIKDEFVNYLIDLHTKEKAWQ